MSRSRIFSFILAAFIFGIFLRSFFEIYHWVYFFVLILCVACLSLTNQKKISISIILIALSFLTGAWRVESKLSQVNDNSYSAKKMEGSGVVLSEKMQQFGRNIIVKMLSSDVNILINVPQYPAYSYGDLLQISCTAIPIENKDDSFDYRMFMAKDNVFYQCEKASVVLLSHEKGNWAMHLILNVRNIFENKIKKMIPQPEGTLAIGILLGGSGGFSKDVQNDFSRTGMTHIVAVSGYNVTIVAEYLLLIGIALGLWRKQATWFALFGIAIFVVIAGMPSSAIRAGVMGGVLLWAMKNGRIATSGNAITFAAAVMLIINPLLLRWDIGFQLSFLATIGIVVISPMFEKNFIKKNRALGITEAILLTISAQIFVIPIIAYNFQTFSTISLLANILVLPLIPISMLLVLLVSFFGFLPLAIAKVIAWIAYMPLHLEMSIIRILSDFSWASVSVNNFSWKGVVLYYSAVIFCLILYKRYDEKKTDL